MRFLYGLVVALALAAVVAIYVVGRTDRDGVHAEPAATPDELAAELQPRREALGQASTPQEDGPAVVEAEAAPAPSASHAEALRWNTINDEGIAALDAGRIEDAIRAFERCYEAQPEVDAFRRNLAEALTRLARREHENGERDPAIEHLARAVELAPERTALADVLARWREAAATEEGFWVDASEHFELAYDGAREELLWSSFDVLDTLEQAYLELGELFGRFPVEHGRARIRVVLYRRAEFREVTGLGHWAGGVFDGTVRVPVEDLGREKRSIERVLRHEVAHAFALDVGGSEVPGWLNEGLAQWLETSAPSDRTGRARAACGRLGSAEPFPLEKLQSGLSRWTDERAIARAYDQSLCFVGWISERYGERVPYELVLGLRAGRTVEESFRARAGDELARAFEIWSTE